MAYKDSLFRSLFGNKKTVLELYNALQGTNYSEKDTEVTINTLSETILTAQKNDLSFVINGKLVVLVEHQASINENMPFRFLQPIVRIFENSIPDKKSIYRKIRVKLPRPEFIVLYNGNDKLPERMTLRLSDAFEQVEGFDKILLELVVSVYNVNEDCNAEIVNRCNELRGYVYFVYRIRYHEANERKKGEVPESEITHIAVRKAIQDCKEKGLLTDYWKSLKPEEEKMLVTEWDMTTALEVEREEGYEKGLEKGREEGRDEGRDELKQEILQLLNNGYTLDAIKEELSNSTQTQ